MGKERKRMMISDWPTVNSCALRLLDVYLSYML